MKMMSFHTPELPEPLGLDLAKLRGGGSCPAQFYGETHEGLGVYVRYRGGALRVHVANKPGDDALDDGQCILQTQIGTRYDGTMSLTQFCTNFGVTVNGIIPEETDPEARRNADLTGQTTYWEGYLRQITIETSRRILSEACSTFPEALLVRPVLNDAYKLERLETTTPEQIDYWNAWLINGPSALAEVSIDPEFGVLPNSDQILVAISFSLWQYPAPRYTSQKRQAEADLGRTLFVPSERGMPEDIALATDTLSLSASFPKENHVVREDLAALGEAIEKLLPATQMECINLVSGDVIDRVEHPVDPAIVEWCSYGNNRWVAVTREKPNSPWVGIRPANL